MELNINKSNFTRFPFLLIAPFFLWGTAMVAMKGVLPHTTPLFVAGVRLVPAGVLVLFVGMMLGKSQPKTLKAWLWISFFALVDGTMFQGFLAEGLQRTNAGLGSVIIDSQPLAVALLSSWLFKEVIGIWGFFGLGFGIVGISLIGFPDQLIYDLWQGNLAGLSFEWHHLYNSGELLMLFASLSMAVGTVTIAFVSRHVDPIIATGWHMILGGIPLFFASQMWETNQWINIDFSGWMALVYSTIFGSAIAYGIFFYLASNGNLTSLSALTFLTPVFALLFGNLFLAESLSNLQWFGVSLTLVSIYLINQRENITKWWQKLVTEKVTTTENTKTSDLLPTLLSIKSNPEIK